MLVAIKLVSFEKYYRCLLNYCPFGPSSYQISGSFRQKSLKYAHNKLKANNVFLCLLKYFSRKVDYGKNDQLNV